MGNPPGAEGAGIDGAAARPQGPKVPAKARPQTGARHGAGLGLVPWIETGNGGPRRVPPLSSFGPHVALAACLFGFAWAAGSFYSGDQWPFSGGNPPSSQTAAHQDRAERAGLFRAVQTMAGDVRALQAGLAALRAGQSQAAKGFPGLDGLTTRLELVRTETSAAMAGLAAKFERLQREPETKLAQMIDRLDRMERKLTFPAAAGSSGPGPAPAGASQKQAQIAAETARPPLDAADGQRKPRLITSWVVRDVYGGIALLESPRGAIEVAPGEIIPGAGRVKSIERRGPGWIVITSQGLVDSARDRFLP
ncbi:MAG: hypothetical protein L0Y60_16880 [Beijerinckiaceae bacterium]|nr:hypothetical protein [Beijerinckiaceae bacterium]